MSDGIAPTVRAMGDVEVTFRLTRREADELVSATIHPRYVLHDSSASVAFALDSATIKLRAAIDAAGRA